MDTIITIVAPIILLAAMWIYLAETLRKGKPVAQAGPIGEEMDQRVGNSCQTEATWLRIMFFGIMGYCLLYIILFTGVLKGGIFAPLIDLWPLLTTAAITLTVPILLLSRLLRSRRYISIYVLGFILLVSAAVLGYLGFKEYSEQYYWDVVFKYDLEYDYTMLCIFVLLQLCLAILLTFLLRALKKNAQPVPDENARMRAAFKAAAISVAVFATIAAALVFILPIRDAVRERVVPFSSIEAAIRTREDFRRLQ